MAAGVLTPAPLVPARQSFTLCSPLSPRSRSGNGGLLVRVRVRLPGPDRARLRPPGSRAQSPGFAASWRWP